MIVTSLEEHTKGRKKVFLDGEYAFTLYSRECKAYGVIPGEELAPEDLRLIREEVLPKRAKLRAMELLQKKTYTKAELAEKMRKGMTPEDCIEKAIAYVESYGYLDDKRYARDYIFYKGRTQSRKRIEQDLMRKGIDKDVINRAYDEVREEDHLPSAAELIRKELAKKHFDPEAATFEEKRKIMAYLYRKGFPSEEIRRAVNAGYDPEVD